MLFYLNGRERKTITFNCRCVTDKVYIWIFQRGILVDLMKLRAVTLSSSLFLWVGWKECHCMEASWTSLFLRPHKAAHTPACSHQSPGVLHRCIGWSTQRKAKSFVIIDLHKFTTKHWICSITQNQSTFLLHFLYRYCKNKNVLYFHCFRC